MYSLVKLIREYRQEKIGSRLTLKLVFTFFLTTLIPLSIIYYFSIQFLDKSIDSWFDTKIEKSLDDALTVGRNSLNVYKNNLIASLNDEAPRLNGLTGKNNLDLIRVIDDIREKSEVTELTLFNNQYDVVATSNIDFKIIPDVLDFNLLSALQTSKSASSYATSKDDLVLKVLLSINSESITEKRYLQASYPLPLRFNELGKNIQSAYDEYNSLKFLRQPLKYSLTVTLSLITLISVLSALWAGIFYARRMISPLTSLAAGTQAVSSGDYSIKLPESTHDELGILVQSFNHMTDKIKQERQAASFSEQRLKDQRQYLETVLNRLSSGVLSFDLNHVLKTSNAMANTTLNTELQDFHNLQLQEMINGDDFLSPLWENIQSNMRKHKQEWQSEIHLFGSKGRQIVNIRGNKLPYESYLRGGYVIVFEDLTSLIRAQRDAAWGEVARRLAHEIKNPLTPIQLSAERIRNKLLHNVVDEEHKEIIDRTTRTIVQQVEAMKQMVDVFREYAQPVNIIKKEHDIHNLIKDITSLFQLDNQVTFAHAFFTDEMKISIDKHKIQQVFNNLILNAKEAYNGDGSLLITIKTDKIFQKDNSYLQIQFFDNGSGIDDAIIDKIFEPYVTNKPKGTGLGLSIVKRTIEEHDGEIIASNNAEKGACFTINLPI